MDINRKELHPYGVTRAHKMSLKIHCSNVNVYIMPLFFSG